MKIIYDHQIFSSQNQGGISRYFVELIKELKNYLKKMKKKALIFGITGQDGAILSKKLLDNNYEVHGLSRKKNYKKFIQIKYQKRH